jgi:hypothetical protein
VPKRRQPQHQHVDPVVEILAKTALIDETGETPVGGRNEPHVDTAHGHVAETTEALLLDDLQQLRLMARSCAIPSRNMVPLRRLEQAGFAAVAPVNARARG